ncbi:hypothetical protein [Kribbella sp. NPDC051770]|uniref:hypothetical protein n=1 Tax=Kribbella sp. NPDC051770 TaxID=3155413 RepID=UPI0034394BBD
MNTDELRTLLKEAGRPVDSPGDPVPVIRHRAKRYRRRQAVAAIACTAVVAAGVVSAVDLWPRGQAEPAGPVATEFPLHELDDTPLQVGNRQLLGDPAPHRELEANGGLYLAVDGLVPGDLVRVRTACPNATAADPVMLSVSLKAYREQQLDPRATPPSTPVPGARRVPCTNSISSTDFVVPARWDWYALAQVGMKANEIRSVKLEVAAYR